MKTSILLLGLFAFFAVVVDSFASQVLTRGDRIFIVDRMGYEWDVTQAVELGFKPHRFQYGIGKDIFITLDDEDLSEAGETVNERSRVIGVELKGSAHAYSVDKLRYHEIANTTLAGQPIAAGY
jgi:hypothetical protein